MQKNIGAKIAELRKARGMKQDELAEMLGVTPQAVSKWENDASMPDIALLPEIADIFDVTIDDLFRDAPKPDVEIVPAEKRKSFDEMILRIRVEDGGDRVKVNLPLPLVKLAVQMGMGAENLGMNIGNIDMSKIDFNHIITLVENGVIGKIVEIEEDGKEVVVVEVC